MIPKRMAVMQWRKSSSAMVEAFDAIAPGPPAERRKMFGYPAAFVNGNFFMGLHQDELVLRLPDDARAELMAAKGARQFEPMPGRPMKEYVVVPAALVRDREAVAHWIARSLAWASSLAPKRNKSQPKKSPASKPRGRK
jgi:TfoX/Sxy family transcriptional regulator of competence genes